MTDLREHERPRILLSIQVGTPRLMRYRDKEILTGYLKENFLEQATVTTTNIVGDRQADLRVHGGVDKAVYAYSRDAYPFWEKRYSKELPFGALGENLTIDSFDEEQIGVGDVFAIGSCRLEVAQPRYPCFKLNARFDDPQAMTAFDSFQRPGIYFRVLEEGVIERGQELQLIDGEEQFVALSELLRLSPETSEAIKERLLTLRSLSESWRNRVRKYS